MKIRSIQSNYFLSILRLTSGILISLITLPYISRVLGPEYLGKVEYINALIAYFILFSSLGIPLYGIKQVAKVRDNPQELSRLIAEIFILLFGTSFVAYCILFFFAFTFDFLIDYKMLIFILSSTILLNNIGLEWLYQGIEDQLFITLRTVAIRVLSVILLYLLVKTKDDYLWYGLIVVLNTAGGNLFNLIKAKQYISFSHLKGYSLDVKRHIKPALLMFLASISVSLYLQVDSILLGYLSGDEAVGYYSVASKLLRVVLLLVTTIGIVMLPRLTNLWEDSKEEYYTLLNKSLSFLLILSIPSSIYLFIFANSIISLMGGSQFGPSIIVLKILSPVTTLVSVAYFFGFLVLFVQNKEKLYAQIVGLSAVISILLNYFLILFYQQNGAALGQLTAEALGMLMLCIAVYKYKIIENKLLNYKENILKIALANIILFLIFYTMNNYMNINNQLIYLFINTAIMIITYIILLVTIREKYTLEILNKLLNHRIWLGKDNVE